MFIHCFQISACLLLNLLPTLSLISTIVGELMVKSLAVHTPRIWGCRETIKISESQITAEITPCEQAFKLAPKIGCINN